MCRRWGHHSRWYMTPTVIMALLCLANALALLFQWHCLYWGRLCADQLLEKLAVSHFIFCWASLTAESLRVLWRVASFCARLLPWIILCEYLSALLISSFPSSVPEMYIILDFIFRFSFSLDLPISSYLFVSFYPNFISSSIHGQTRAEKEILYWSQCSFVYLFCSTVSDSEKRPLAVSICVVLRIPLCINWFLSLIYNSSKVSPLDFIIPWYRGCNWPWVWFFRQHPCSVRPLIN